MKESITKIIKDAELGDQKCITLCGETRISINTRVEQIERENKKYGELFSSMKEELEGIHQFLKTLTDEITSLKANFSVPTEDKCDLNSYKNRSRCHDHNQIIREIREMKADNKNFFEEMTTRLYRDDTKPLDNKEPEEYNNTKNASCERPKHSGTSPTPPIHPQEENDVSHSQISTTYELQLTTNPQAMTSSEIKTDNTASNNRSNTLPVPGKTYKTPITSNGTERHQVMIADEDRSQGTAKREEKDTTLRETYRRELNPKNDNDGARGGETRLGNVTIDGSSHKDGPKFSTRKCMVIHDPYFKDFDKSKFSRWYDITTCRYDTLLKAKKDPSLLPKIKKLSPAVVYLHIGQADLLNQTPGDTVISNLTWLIKEIMDKTSAKICVSLIIPLSCIPQVKSVIRQVNREITNLITDLRATKRRSNRVFTQNNDALGDFIARSTSANGTVVSLNNRGQRKLWLHLRDGLNRALDLSPRRTSDTSNSKGAKSLRTETPRSRSRYE